MPKSWTSIALTVLLTFWFSGAARYAHERLDHRCGGAACHVEHQKDVRDAAGAPLPSDPSPDHSDPSHPDKDHCVLCHTLATVTSVSIDVPPLCFVRPPLALLHLRPTALHVVRISLDSSPTRGPPTA